MIVSYDKEALSSVSNAIRIMREFSQEEPELGITELSRRLGLTKSAVFRIVRTLEKENILRKNPQTRKYYLWLTALEIGSVVYHDNDVAQIALPILKQMRALTPGVVQLVMYDRGGIVYLLKLPEDKDTRIFNSMGKRVPAYCTASGKMLLAHQDETEINRVLSEELKPMTEHTITSPEKLSLELVKIREAGYAVSREEFKIGMSSVAVPIYDDFDRVIAAISVTRPKNLFSPAQIVHYVNEMRMYSRLITEQLGVNRISGRLVE
jgi:DNA-binding IclR family transcriptional regulator